MKLNTSPFFFFDNLRYRTNHLEQRASENEVSLFPQKTIKLKNSLQIKNFKDLSDFVNKLAHTLQNLTARQRCLTEKRKAKRRKLLNKCFR